MLKTTWPFQDKYLYFKINNYKTTQMDKFCELDREILSMTPSCLIITKKYMAQRHNKLNKTAVFS